MLVFFGLFSVFKVVFIFDIKYFRGPLYSLRLSLFLRVSSFLRSLYFRGHLHSFRLSSFLSCKKIVNRHHTKDFHTKKMVSDFSTSNPGYIVHYKKSKGKTLNPPNKSNQWNQIQHNNLSLFYFLEISKHEQFDTRMCCPMIRQCFSQKTHLDIQMS